MNCIIRASQLVRNSATIQENNNYFRGLSKLVGVNYYYYY